MPRVKRWVSRVIERKHTSGRPRARLVPQWWVLLGAALLILGWLPVSWVRLAGTVWATAASTGFSGLVFLCGAGVLAVGAFDMFARIQRRSHADERPTVRPLRWWWVGLIAAGITVVTGVALWWLLGLVAQSPPDRVPQAQVEAVRTALTLGAGLVGVVALVLTSRKQWLAEHTQRHTESDATEQRATELYTAAAEQLASDKAPVRLAGLYALERLGEYNREHRQTVVNLLCAYLRMPFAHPDPECAAAPSNTRKGDEQPAPELPTQQPLLLDLAPTLAAAAGLSLDGAERQWQELQVRLTAQRIITDHLKPKSDQNDRPTNPKFWADIDLDLAGAVLDSFNMSDCHVKSARFDRTHFHGGEFSRAHFHGGASFSNAHIEAVGLNDVNFYDEASFDSAYFFGAYFESTHFHGKAIFECTRFDFQTHFTSARFHGRAWFGQARFDGYARFKGAHFHGKAGFTSALFYDKAWFTSAHFHDEVEFASAVFDNEVEFAYAHFHKAARFDEDTRFRGKGRFDNRTRFHGEVTFDDAGVRWDVDRSDDAWPAGWIARPPQNDEAGQIDGLDGVWGCVTTAKPDQQPDKASDQPQGARSENADSV